MWTESTFSQCYNYTITAWEYDHSKMLYSALCLSPFSYTHTGVVGIFPKILLGTDGKIICFSFSRHQCTLLANNKLDAFNLLGLNIVA